MRCVPSTALADWGLKTIDLFDYLIIHQLTNEVLEATEIATTSPAWRSNMLDGDVHLLQRWEKESEH